MLRRPLTVLPRLLPAASRPAAWRPASGIRRSLPTVTSSRSACRQPFSTSSTARTTCPQCSSPLPTPLPVCTKCFYISNIPAEMSYHEMLGTPYEPNPFVLNNAEIKKQFRTLQSIIHPDRWVGKSSQHQEVASVMSARINDALHRLSDPLRRVEYILEREGLGGEETDKLEDPKLLLEIMELREEIESAASEDDVERVRQENREKMEETIQEIETLVGKKDWPAVKGAAVKLKYLLGIENAADAWPNSFNDR